MEGKWSLRVRLLQWYLCTHSWGRQVGRLLERDGGCSGLSQWPSGWRICLQFRRLEVDPWIRGGRRQETGEPSAGSPWGANGRDGLLWIELGKGQGSQGPKAPKDMGQDEQRDPRIRVQIPALPPPASVTWTTCSPLYSSPLLLFFSC